jgi:FKBP-type peptidyl-prolyl cis-trans isomerase
MKKISCLVVLLALVSACGGNNDSPTAPSVNVPFSTTDVRVGTGVEATAGRTASVNYTLYHYSATAADNKGGTLSSGPFSFVVGGSQAIAGFSQATLGMKVGGLRRAIIPPSLAYGNNPPANSGIQANETLVFEIELLSVQ